MSVVSGVTLQISCAEEFIEQKSGPDVIPLVDEVNAWLAAKNFKPLTSLEDHYGGNKHPQVLVYGAGYNYFCEEDFAQFVMALRWNAPECVVLLINPEEGPTKIFRVTASRH